MTEQQAAEALFAAVQEDTGRAEHGDAGEGAKPAAPVSAESKPDPQPAEPVTPEGESAQVVTPEQPVDSFTKLDPNAIPEEMQPYYKSMLGDYTRKTQELAERARAYEALGEVEEAKVAVELLQSLGTIEGAQSFYELLGQTLGLPQAATPVITPPPPAAQVEAPSFDDDPEAALRFMYEQQRDELQSLKDSLEAERVAAAQEAQYFQLAGELSRQESLIRDANPHYGDEQINAIYEIATAYGGDLVSAQRRYDEIVSNELSRMLNGKAAAAQDTGVHPVAAPSYAEPTAPTMSLDQAHVAALEHLRQLEAQDV